MSNVNVPGFKSSAIFQQMQAAIENAPSELKNATIKQANGIFEFQVKNADGKEQTWTADLKKNGTIIVGKGSEKPDIILTLGDDVLGDLATGKLNGQKAFMTNKLKVKGNMMLAMKLDGVLKQIRTAPAAPSGTPAAPVAPAASSNGSSSNLELAGFESSAVFKRIADDFGALSPADRKSQIQKVKAVFQFNVKNGDGKVQTWSLDLKNGDGEVIKGAFEGKKPDIQIDVADADFVALSQGKLNGQKAFMQGKLKIKGNMMLATKLDTVLKSSQPKSKL
jgi:putative sterol carrier protein